MISVDAQPGDIVTIELEDGDWITATAEHSTEPELDGESTRLVTRMGTIRWRSGACSFWHRQSGSDPLLASAVKSVTVRRS